MRRYVKSMHSSVHKRVLRGKKKISKFFPSAVMVFNGPSTTFNTMWKVRFFLLLFLGVHWP